MCEELRDVWHVIKADTGVNAVVLRGAGDRAFSAGLDIKEDFGQPDDVWHHDDPGEFISPKWQKLWKPVVCAVHGICTAGAFYFLNESDVVICSDDATFFDSHVTYGLVSALEPVGLMRRIGLGETLRMALIGNAERVSAATALRLGLVSEVVAHDELFARAHELAGIIASYPDDRDRGHGPRDLGVPRQAVSRRHGPGPHLHPPREPDRLGARSIAPTCRRRRRGSVDRDRPPRSHRCDLRPRSARARARVRGPVVRVVGVGEDRRRRRRRHGRDRDAPPVRRSPCCCGIARPRSA